MMTHTPGPWIEFSDQGNTVAIMPAGRPGDVCNFAKPYPSRADAQLMAADPVLLEALIAITDQLERIGDTRIHKDGSFIAAARDAIDVATVVSR
jgi:hypothetical protein